MCSNQARGICGKEMCIQSTALLIKEWDSIDKGGASSILLLGGGGGD